MRTARTLTCLALAVLLCLLSPGPQAYATLVDAPNAVPEGRIDGSLPLTVDNLGFNALRPGVELQNVSIDGVGTLAIPTSELSAQAQQLQHSAQLEAAAQTAQAERQAAAVTSQQALTRTVEGVEKADAQSAPDIIETLYSGDSKASVSLDPVYESEPVSDVIRHVADDVAGKRSLGSKQDARASQQKPRAPRSTAAKKTAAMFAVMGLIGMAGLPGGFLFHAAASLLAYPFIVALIVAHEMGHAAAALALGDDGPKREGRLSLTLDGLKSHVDPLGTIYYPLVSMLAGWLPFGWGRQVNPSWGHSRAGMAIIGAAGPLVNVAALGVLLLGAHALAAVGAPVLLLAAAKVALMTNVLLAAFNLIPVFPLDGHWILRAAIPRTWADRWDRFNAKAATSLANDGTPWWPKLKPYVPLVLVFVIGNVAGLFGGLLALATQALWSTAISGTMLASAALPAVAALGLMIGQVRQLGPPLLNPGKPAAVEDVGSKPTELIVKLSDRAPARLTKDVHLSNVDLARRGGTALYAKTQQDMLAELAAAGLPAEALASYGATPIATYRRVNMTTLRVDAARAGELRAALEAAGHEVHENKRRKIIQPVPNDPQGADPAMRKPVTMPEVLALTKTEAVHKIAAELWGAPEKARSLLKRLLGKAPAQTPIAVIDSGAKVEHPLLKFVKKVVNVTSGENKDDIGHGSWVTSMVLNFAPWNRNLTHYKTFVDGGATTDDILKALTAAGNDGNLVISNSWGSDDGDPKGPDSQLVLQLAKEGHVLVFAAGNAGPGANTIGSPAVVYFDAGQDALRVVSVAAAGRDKVVSRFSSRGEKSPATKDDPSQAPRPDALAIGANVEGAWPDELGPDRVDSEKGPLKAISGTSMSTPDVAGAIALLCMLFGVTTKGERLDAVVRAVIQSLEPTGQGHAAEGRGFLNVEGAYRLLEKALGSPAGAPAWAFAERARLEKAEAEYQKHRRDLLYERSFYNDDVDPILQRRADERKERLAELEAAYPALKRGWWWKTFLGPGEL